MASSTELSQDLRSWWKALTLVGVLFIVLYVITLILFLVLILSTFVQEEEEIIQAEVSEAFPAHARKYLKIYKEAGKKYGVPWQVLAAIHKVETDFGRNLSKSSVGASGHMQFMDKTWVGWSFPGGTALGDLPDTVDITDPKLIEKYGGYGTDGDGDGKADPNNPVDAIYTAAKYLAANKKPGVDWFDPNGPVYQYNHSSAYVAKVKQYADAFSVLPTDALSPGWVFPVDGGKITSKFGMRKHPKTGRWRMHEGVDIAKGMGAPIRAVEAGTVVESRPATGYGWIIVIDHKQYQTVYAHMYRKDVKVKVGDRVEKGQIIALMGSNGNSTGPHLHLELRKMGVPVDPMPFLRR